MTRPNDIPDPVILAALDTVLKPLGTAMRHYSLHSARQGAIDAMRGVLEAVDAEARERCAAIADAYADENIAMAGDTILMDPILSRRPSDGPVTVQELERSEDLMVGGTIHSSMFHAAQNIASAIRSGT